MPFEADDLFVGMIAYYRVRDLCHCPRIHHTATSDDAKPRPFICYAEADGLCYWTCFTSKAADWRPIIARHWLRIPPCAVAHRFSSADMILSNPGDSYVGTPHTFAKLSHRNDAFEGMWRPMLLPEGVAEVQDAVLRRRGLLPRPVRKTALQRRQSRKSESRFAEACPAARAA